MSQQQQKRRRVLSNINNTHFASPEAKNKSISFDLVRIPSSESTFTSLKPQNGPKEEENSTLNTSNLAVSKQTMNRKGSNIPTLKTTSYERLLTINENLNRKSLILSTEIKTPLLSSTEELFLHHSHTKELLEERHLIDTELIHAEKELSIIEEESQLFKMLYRALKNEISELSALISDQQAKFERQLAQITNKVELRQREIDIDLKNYSRQLDDTFKATEFDLEIELHLAQEFEDTHLFESIKLLNEDKLDLQRQYKTQQESKEKILLAEQTSIQELMKSIDEELSGDWKIAASRLEAQKAQNKKLAEDNQRFQNMFTEQTTKIENLKQQISSMNDTITNYEKVKLSLEQELVLVSNEHRLLETQEYEMNAKVAAAKHSYDIQHSRYQSYKTTVRVLEHAISAFSPGLLTFLRVGNHILKSQHQLEIQSTVYAFDKVSELRQGDDSSEDWNLFVQDCLQGSHLSFVFTGTETRGIDHLLDIFSFLKKGEERHQGWKFGYSLQSIGCQDLEIVDVLNPSTVDLRMEFIQGKMSLSSQRMLLLQLKDVSTALNIGTFEDNVAYLHVFSVVGEEESSGRTIQGAISVVDLTKLKVDMQTCLLGDVSASFGELIKYCQDSSRCLHICDVRDKSAPGIKSLLQALPPKRLDTI